MFTTLRSIFSLSADVLTQHSFFLAPQPAPQLLLLPRLSTSFSLRISVPSLSFTFLSSFITCPSLATLFRRTSSSISFDSPRPVLINTFAHVAHVLAPISYSATFLRIVSLLSCLTLTQKLNSNQFISSIPFSHSSLQTVRLLTNFDCILHIAYWTCFFYSVFSPFSFFFFCKTLLPVIPFRYLLPFFFQCLGQPSLVAVRAPSTLPPRRLALLSLPLTPFLQPCLHHRKMPFRTRFPPTRLSQCPILMQPLPPQLVVLLLLVPLVLVAIRHLMNLQPPPLLFRYPLRSSRIFIRKSYLLAQFLRIQKLRHCRHLLVARLPQNPHLRFLLQFPILFQILLTILRQILLQNCPPTHLPPTPLRRLNAPFQHFPILQQILTLPAHFPLLFLSNLTSLPHLTLTATPPQIIIIITIIIQMTLTSVPLSITIVPFQTQTPTATTTIIPGTNHLGGKPTPSPDTITIPTFKNPLTTTT